MHDMQLEFPRPNPLVQSRTNNGSMSTPNGSCIYSLFPHWKRTCETEGQASPPNLKSRNVRVAGEVKNALTTSRTPIKPKDTTILFAPGLYKLRLGFSIFLS